MKNFGKIGTSIQADERPAVPSQVGATFNFNSDPQNCENWWKEQGWRRLTAEQTPAEGFRVGSSIVVDSGDGETATIEITQINIAEEQEQQAAEQQALYEADIVANASRYTYENAFLLLCDQLTQQSSHSKLPMEQLTVILAQLRTLDKDSYEKSRDILNVLNAALSRFDLKWWDVCQYRNVPILIQGAQQLLGLI